MSDILDRLNERCWPHETRDELCMDAVYVITDLRARLAEVEAERNAAVKDGLRLIEQVDSLAAELRADKARLAEAETLLRGAPVIDPPWRSARDYFLRTTTSADARPCTCHPDDNPPVPCPRKYALTECAADIQDRG